MSCRPCKGRKVKCGEEHPTCINCQRTGEVCDYSVRLNWEGRRTRRSSSFGTPSQASQPTPPDIATQTQQSSFSHTFCINGAPTSIQPKPIARRVQTDIGSTGLEKRKQDGRDVHANHAIGSVHDKFYSTPPQELYKAVPSPPVVKDVIDKFSFVSDARPGASGAASSLQRPHKRSKSFAESSDKGISRRPGLLDSPSLFIDATPPIHRIRSNTCSTSRDSPLTPISSGTTAKDDPRTPLLTLPSPTSPGQGRISVDYLLSDSPDIDHHPKHDMQDLFGPSLSDIRFETEASEEAKFYGYDLGIRDTDIDQNNDFGAISPTASNVKDVFSTSNDGYSDALSLSQSDARYSFSTLPGVAGGYYDRPVSIWIPRNIEPLPLKLQSNPMNLLPKHHFINHTAKILVPYDDINSNPFRTILPQMATKNDHLLSLLLAYSASHRARLLRQREPEMRIALWVQDIFPALRLALGDKEQIISNTSLATAIMLASLEIISPTAFGYDIPWQTHLNLARDLMRRRLADLRRTPNVPEEDRECSFLWSWFAYLDVLGSLSGGLTGGEPSRSWVLEYNIFNGTEDLYEIDCIMGFTTRCVQLIAQVSDLARHCDIQRIRSGNQAPSDWIPTLDCVRRAQQLEHGLMESMAQPSHPCKHVKIVGARDIQELVLLNEAFHWAGLVHLHRRVLGKLSGHADVQGPVQRIYSCMEYITPGGTTETGFLFPMFTAGCNTLDEGQKTRILQRFRSVESNGMTQVHKARQLMENVWLTGQPWEPLLCTEFIG
ncbi:C6 zinc finger protein [Colletotrichum truncatum]|uniref:C6 zinc finger protein n=1 Tax=Colletotrichum truncatum TaxID=5467 RepID=A0ACC3Z4K7_COLTU